MMHLLCHILRRVIIAMQCLVSIQTQLMGPCLKSWGNSMLSRQLVDTLFQLPCFDIRSELL